MAASNDKVNKVLGAIAAIRTLLEDYPSLYTPNFNIGQESLIGFLLRILRMFGLTEEEIIEWLSTLLAGKAPSNGSVGKAGDGILFAIEQVVKAALMANIKNMLTCSLNPFIPDSLMYSYKNEYGNTVGGKGIEINLDAIDLYGTLKNCPISETGHIFYFDAMRSICDEEGTMPMPFYPINDLYKSCDFNAYLWFVINKGSNVGAERNKLYWDNRNNHVADFKINDDLRKKFFSTFADGNVTTENGVIKKKRILITEFTEIDNGSENRLARSNVLKVWVNPDQYYRKRRIKLGKKGYAIEFNKTLFEFNFDYIYSLKLFDAKVIVANIVNAILGIGKNLGNYSIVHDVIAAQIGEIVKKRMNMPDSEIDDCYFNFSNEEYDMALLDSVNKLNGQYISNLTEEDVAKIFNDINEIGNATSEPDQITKIKNVFTSISAIAAQNGSVYAHDRFEWGLDILYKMIQETITQLVVQILSPKVAMLFAINQEIMGHIDSDNKKLWEANWEDFMKNMRNVIIKTIDDIIEIFVKQMLEFILKKLTHLLKAFLAKLLLETINDYMMLLENLITNCIFFFAFNGGNNTKNEYAIDNVNYADIVPKQVSPPKKLC